MDRYLVTGGAGMVGTNLVRRLDQSGARILVLDNLTSGFAQSLPSSVELLVGDVRNVADVEAAFKIRPDYVVHLAAWFANQNSIDHPAEDLSTNALGTLNVLEAARKHRLARLVYASSSCVYGARSGQLSEEMAPGVPDTPYAATKWLGEEYVRIWGRIHGLPCTIVRLFNVYGPWDFPGLYRSVIPNFIATSLREGELKVTGTGTETRDFTFVGDVVSALIELSHDSGSEGVTVNIGTGQETSIGDLARSIVELTDSNSRIAFVPRRGWDHVASRRAATSQLEERLGWRPATTISEGLERTISWFRHHVSATS